jgi:hypothetical protein
MTPADILHTVVIALAIACWISALSLLISWALDQGTHCHVVEAIHVSGDRYRVEFAWCHHGVWYGGWVVGSELDWHHEQSVTRVHPKVSAWLYRQWGALERHRCRKPLHQESALCLQSQ